MLNLKPSLPLIVIILFCMCQGMKAHHHYERRLPRCVKTLYNLPIQWPRVPWRLLVLLHRVGDCLQRMSWNCRQTISVQHNLLMLSTDNGKAVGCSKAPASVSCIIRSNHIRVFSSPCWRNNQDCHKIVPHLSCILACWSNMTFIDHQLIPDMKSAVLFRVICIWVSYLQILSNQLCWLKHMTMSHYSHNCSEKTKRDLSDIFMWPLCNTQSIT